MHDILSSRRSIDSSRLVRNRIACLMVMILVLTFSGALCGAEKGKSKRTKSTRKRSVQKKESTPDNLAVKSLGTSEPTTPVASGSVPQFSSATGIPYSSQTENEYYNRILARQDDTTLAPRAPAKLRFYTDWLISKYDRNNDGQLQESEWSALPSGQAIDTNGDLILTSDEILFYMVRYSRNRTIFRPEVALAASRRHEVVSRPMVTFQPLSAKVKPVTKPAAKRTRTEKELADYNEEQIRKLLSSAESAAKSAETQDDQESAEKMLESVKGASVREYAVSASELKGMPRWFVLRDTNGDGQLSLREFAPGLDVESVAFFGRIDANADGLVTPEELRAYVIPK